LALSGCTNKAPRHEPRGAFTHFLKEITEKKKSYCEQSHDAYFKKGYVHSKCDGLLFTSLYAMACPKATIEKFEGEPGRWYRSPTHDCMKKKQSSTSISRDMLIGLMHYINYYGDEGKLKRLIKYGQENNWIMGESTGRYDNFTTPVLTPQLVALLIEMDGGDSLVADFSQPTINTGYKAHLDILRILLKGSVLGSIGGTDLRVLKSQAERNPNNALFRAAYSLYLDGNMDTAAGLLMDPKHFPDKLPTSSNHCTEYLYQRDENTDSWRPCDEGKTHSGTDLLFTSLVILGKIR
jgi:hypothetical protein